MSDGDTKLASLRQRLHEAKAAVEAMDLLRAKEALCKERLEAYTERIREHEQKRVASEDKNPELIAHWAHIIEAVGTGTYRKDEQGNLEFVPDNPNSVVVEIDRRLCDTMKLMDDLITGIQQLVQHRLDMQTKFNVGHSHGLAQELSDKYLYVRKDIVNYLDSIKQYKMPPSVAARLEDDFIPEPVDLLFTELAKLTNEAQAQALMATFNLDNARNKLGTNISEEG